jgi:hypothetical protein
MMTTIIDEAKSLLAELTALETPDDPTELNQFAQRVGAFTTDDPNVSRILEQCIDQLWSLRAAALGEPMPIIIRGPSIGVH